MKTKIIRIEEVFLIVPIQYQPPYQTLAEYKNCCGAGTGFQEKIVPDTMWGLSISAACHIHDFCWEMADAKWSNFHQSNSMFLHNLMAIIRARSNSFTRMLRNYRAITMFDAVDMVGASHFWDLKHICPPAVDMPTEEELV